MVRCSPNDCLIEDSVTRAFVEAASAFPEMVALFYGLLDSHTCLSYERERAEPSVNTSIVDKVSVSGALSCVG